MNTITQKSTKIYHKQAGIVIPHLQLPQGVWRQPTRARSGWRRPDVWRGVDSFVQTPYNKGCIHDGSWFDYIKTPDESTWGASLTNPVFVEAHWQSPHASSRHDSTIWPMLTSVLAICEMILFVSLVDRNVCSYYCRIEAGQFQIPRPFQRRGFSGESKRILPPNKKTSQESIPGRFYNTTELKKWRWI